MENTANYDWYEDTMEIETTEYFRSEAKKSIFQRLFDLSIHLFRYIAIITAILWLTWYILGISDFTIFGASFMIIMAQILFYYGSIGIIAILVRYLCHFSKKFGEAVRVKVQCGHRWLILFIWYSIKIYSYRFFKDYLGSARFLVLAYLRAGLVTSFVFWCFSIAMQYFYESFVQKSLSAKMSDVEMSERILAAMKDYQYENSDSTDSVSNDNLLSDLFDWNITTNDNDNQFEVKKNKRVGALYLKDPELQSVFEAKKLAKDVFEKASNKSETLTFVNFSSIFPNDQISLQAFPFFESTCKNEIVKNEFRDTILHFYVNRIYLEKNFEIAKGFVSIIGDIFTIVISAFLFLAYLVIFGIPVKELLALALSSAFLINFLVSGAATDIYYNILMLLTHPFDVGDEVVIDNVDYKVYKIGLASTSFIAPNGGKIKFVNSNLWKKTLVNMTRAPEKIIAFDFKLDPDLDLVRFGIFKTKLQQYLKERSYDFYETFTVESISESNTSINMLNCRLVLKCKNLKTKSRKFSLRVEMTKIINELILLLGIKLVN